MNINEYLDILKSTLMVDASDFAIGGSLAQLKDKILQPLAFYSKTLSPAQKKYSTYVRELYAAYASVKHFKYMLEGRDFKIISDHKPLSYAFCQNLEKASPRQFRYLDFLYTG